MKNKDLGFKKEQIVVVPLADPSLRKGKVDILKNRLMQHPNIKYVTASSGVPTKVNHMDPFYPEGLDNKDCTVLHSIAIDHDFIKTFGMEIIKGRDFSSDLFTDAKSGILVNEAAIKKIGWENPIGKKIEWVAVSPSVKYSVIGVVKDFHFTHLVQEISPVVFQVVPANYQYISIKIQTEHISETMAFIKKEMHALSPYYPFDLFFIDEAFDSLYKIEQKISRIMTFFSIIAILIACLGLFGLISYAIQNRTKEIGIRKVLGASVSGILSMLTQDYIKWIALANLIAWPVAYYALDKLLQYYAYRIDITIWPFLLAGTLALVIALLTVSYQAIRAATANPVESLRYE